MSGGSQKKQCLKSENAHPTFLDSARKVVFFGLSLYNDKLFWFHENKKYLYALSHWVTRIKLTSNRHIPAIISILYGKDKYKQDFLTIIGIVKNCAQQYNDGKKSSFFGLSFFCGCMWHHLSRREVVKFNSIPNRYLLRNMKCLFLIKSEDQSTGNWRMERMLNVVGNCDFCDGSKNDIGPQINMKLRHFRIEGASN